MLLDAGILEACQTINIVPCDTEYLQRDDVIIAALKEVREGS